MNSTTVTLLPEIVAQIETDTKAILAQGTRAADWGHWGINFYHAKANGYDAQSFDFELPFACGAQGPVDGFLGSPLRLSYGAAIKNWRESGVMPVGAQCAIGKRWLYELS